MESLDVARPRGLAAMAVPTFAAVWLAAVAIGFASLFDYGAEPGRQAVPPAAWPEAVDLERDPRLPTLLLFAHPHCPCTSATVAELERLLARCQDRVAVTVLFYADDAIGTGWERSALWERSSAIPGVRVTADPLGAMARAFGAQTSGTALLYTADGRLVFAGGITPARGHEGDNVGSAAIAAIVTSAENAAEVERANAPVFGCELIGSSAADYRR